MSALHMRKLSLVAMTPVSSQGSSIRQLKKELADRLAGELDRTHRLQEITDFLRKHLPATRSAVAAASNGSEEEGDELMNGLAEPDAKRQQVDKNFEGELLKLVNLAGTAEAEDPVLGVLPNELLQMIFEASDFKTRETFLRMAKVGRGVFITFYRLNEEPTVTVEDWWFKTFLDVFRWDPKEPGFLGHKSWSSWLNTYVNRFRSAGAFDWKPAKRRSAPPTTLQDVGMQPYATLFALAEQLVQPNSSFVERLYTERSGGILRKLLFFHDTLATNFSNLHGFRNNNAQRVAQHKLVRLYKTHVNRLLHQTLVHMIHNDEDVEWQPGDAAEREFLARYLMVFPPDYVPSWRNGDAGEDAGPHSTSIAATFLPERVGRGEIYQMKLDGLVINPNAVESMENALGALSGFIRGLTDDSHGINRQKPPVYAMLGEFSPVSILHMQIQRGSMNPQWWRETVGDESLRKPHGKALTTMLLSMRDANVLDRIQLRINGDIRVFYAGRSLETIPFNITPYNRIYQFTGFENADVDEFSWRVSHDDRLYLLDQWVFTHQLPVYFEEMPLTVESVEAIEAN